MCVIIQDDGIKIHSHRSVFQPSDLGAGKGRDVSVLVGTDKVSGWMVA
jgi:hypothetical protein